LAASTSRAKGFVSPADVRQSHFRYQKINLTLRLQKRYGRPCVGGQQYPVTEILEHITHDAPHGVVIFHGE